MDKKMTPEEFAAKLEWEGDIYELATSYGLNPDSLEDGPLKDSYAKFYEHAKKLTRLEAEVRKHIPDIDDL